MPQEAPSAQGPSVTPEVQPQIQATTQVPLAAAGGGPVRDQLAAVGNESAQHLGMAIQMEVIKANQTSAEQRSAKATRQLQTIMNGDGTADNPGFLNMKQNNAISAAPQVYDQMQKLHDQIAATAPNKEVGRMFEQSWNNIYDRTHGVMQEHLTRQIEAHQSSVTQAAVESKVDLAVGAPNTPAGIALTTQAWDSARETLRMQGLLANGPKLNGTEPVMGPDGKAVASEATELALRQFDEKFAASKAQSLLDKDGGKAALDWLQSDRVKAAMDANPKAYNGMIDTASNQYARDQAFNVLGPQIVKKHGPKNQGEAEKEALAIPEDKYHLREETLAAVKQLYAADKQTQRDNDAKAQGYEWDYLRQTGQVPPGTDWKRANQLRVEFNNYQKGPALGKSKPEAVQALRAMFSSTDPAVLNDAATEDLQGYRSELSDADMKAFQGLQKQLRTPGPKHGALGDVHNWRAQTEVVNEALIATGVDPNQPKNDMVTSIRSEVDERVNEAKTTGQKLTRKDYQDIAWDVTRKHVMANAPSVTSPAGGSAPAAVTPRAGSVDEIPSSRLLMIKGLLKSQNLPVNDRSILQVDATLPKGG